MKKTIRLELQIGQHEDDVVSCNYVDIDGQVELPEAVGLRLYAPPPGNKTGFYFIPVAVLEEVIGALKVMKEQIDRL